jgi:hypothetical protein
LLLTPIRFARSRRAFWTISVSTVLAGIVPGKVDSPLVRRGLRSAASPSPAIPCGHAADAAIAKSASQTGVSNLMTALDWRISA